MCIRDSNHSPSRPYANFFVDFAAIEHRALFWQVWALGVRGVHYWSINYLPDGRDPRQGLLDITPVNGDGFLVYPSASGPAPSIRWETVRDGIEDYDYLVLFRELQKRVEKSGNKALLSRVQAAACLLYTSDAADELHRVDLAGRRIIKKKNER